MTKSIYIMLVLLGLTLLFSLDAYATLQFQDCVTADPYFSITLDPSNPNRSVQSIPRLDFTVDTLVRITSDSSVTVRRVDFGLLPTMDTRINSLTDQRVTGSDYLLYVNARFNDNAHKNDSVGNNVRINGIAARIMYDDANGNLDMTYICVPPITLRITGSQTSLPEEVDKRIKEIEKRIETAEKIQLVLAVMNLMSTFSCQEKTNELNIAKSVFEANCNMIHEVLRNISLSINDTDALCVDTDNSSALHIDNCNLCINYYNTLVGLKTETANACQRLECSDMISFAHFKNTFPGDIIGLNYCDENKDYYDAAKCEKQYRASEQPKCWLQDPVELSKNAENPASGFNPLGFITGFDFCSDKRDPIQVIKSPANDLFSSLTCGCFPGLLGWSDLYLDSLKMELQCVKGATSRNLSTCRNALFVFGCDMLINALTCGGVNFGIHNNDARFLFRHSDGSSIDMSDLTPQQIREYINDGYTTMISGSVSFDTSELIHNVCSSVFGDKDVDWAETILSGIDVGSTDVISLCPTGSVRGPCYCGSDFESATINCGNTPSNNYCDFSDGNPTGECTGTVTIPVPEPSIDVDFPADNDVEVDENDYNQGDNPDIIDSQYSAQYYHRMSADVPVRVEDCVRYLDGRGVYIRVRSFSDFRITDYYIRLYNRYHTTTNSGSIHKFFCLDDNRNKVNRGTHVVRIEHDESGNQLPPEQQTPFDNSNAVRATEAQISSLASMITTRIINECKDLGTRQDQYTRSRAYSNIRTATNSYINSFATCIADYNQYPQCRPAPYLFDSADKNTAKNRLIEEMKKQLEDYDRIRALPIHGEPGSNDISFSDIVMRGCIHYLEV